MNLACYIRSDVKYIELGNQLDNRQINVIGN